jgi:uncharacterized protein
MKITWDAAKARRNPLAHEGVTFEEAQTVLLDPLALTREDDDARGEVRLVTLGRSVRQRCLIVVWTEREEEEIRIISAWKANAQQRNRYEQQLA